MTPEQEASNKAFMKNNSEIVANLDVEGKMRKALNSEEEAMLDELIKKKGDKFIVKIVRAASAEARLGTDGKITDDDVVDEYSYVIADFHKELLKSEESK